MQGLYPSYALAIADAVKCMVRAVFGSFFTLSNSRCDCSLSRLARPELCASIALFKQRAQGRPGACRPHGPPANKMQAAEPQVWPDIPSLPARQCYGLYVISLVRRACWPPSLAARHRELGISVGMPGPHDFAVARACARHAQPTRPSLPALDVRDDAYAPPYEAG